MSRWKMALYAGVAFGTAGVTPIAASAQVATGAQPAGGVQPSAEQVSAIAGAPDAQSDRPGQLGEIIVTAQRREERLSDVPISVTALGAQQLKNQQITDVTSLAGAVPSVNVLTGLGDPSDIAIGIRGLASLYLELNYDNPVGVYVNGIYFSRTAGANVGTVDMQSVEVLRGPQGTLFGRNTIGGALNITTAKPTDRFEGSVTGDFGNYSTTNFTGIVNVPISGDKVDMRLVYQHVHHGPYGHDDYLDEGLASQNQNYVRGTLTVKPVDRWKFDFYGDYLWLNGDSQVSELVYADPNNPLTSLIPALQGHPGDSITNYVGEKNFHNDADLAPRLRVRTYTASATVTGDLGWATVKSITSYHGEHAQRGLDADASPYAYFNIPYQPFSYHQTSQELQVYGDAMNNRLHWITGAYYFQEVGTQGTTVQIAQPVVPQQNNLYHALNRNLSAFVQLGYDLTDKLRLTAGARYSADHREITYLDTVTVGGVTVPELPAIYGQKLKANFHFVPWTVNLDYKPNAGTLFYLKVSQGFRSGGYPQGGYSELEDYAKFNPENLISPEVGAKLDLLDHHLKINAAAYYSWYSKIQQTRNFEENGVDVSITANIGDAHLYGGELEATALLGKLRLSAGGGLVHATFTKGPLVGQPFVSTPRWTGSLSASYPIDLSAGALTLNADYAWRSRVYFADPVDAVDATAAKALQQKSFGLVNAKATLALARLPIELSLWTRNLADKHYKAQALNFSALGVVPAIPGDPRTFGGTISYKF